MREWRDIHSQLHALAAEHQWQENQLPATYDAIHRALLAGLLGNLGCKSEDSAHYLGARGIKFLIHPGSALQKKAGKWIVAAEISETTRLFARCVARIEPEWLERVGAHLLKRSWFDPHWEKKAMQAIAFERITLYGIVVDPRRRVNFGPLNPPAAREIFIRQALVGGEVSEEFERRWGFFTHNQQLMLDIETLEHKSRRPDVLVDDELIFAFYDRICPRGHLQRRELRQVAARGRARDAAPALPAARRPDAARGRRRDQRGLSASTAARRRRLRAGLPLRARQPRDGVTLTVPLAQLNQIPAARCEWLVPGLLKEKVQQLVKTLPQRLRAKLVPVPDFAAEFVAQVPPSDKPLVMALIASSCSRAGSTRAAGRSPPTPFAPTPAGAPLVQLPPARRERPPARHEPQPERTARRVGTRGEAGVRRAARDARRVFGNDRLEFGECPS
jgi:ATP-dependent helicase HrpA